MRRYVLFCVAVFLNSAAWAEIEVEIVDSPQWMLGHGPVFVTAKVKNTGRTALLVPVKEGCLASNGYFIEIGRPGQTLKAECGTIPSRIGGSRWMEPGDEWLVQNEIRDWPEGAGSRVL